jgi:REP element-mobilizing transposase RayT
VHHVWARAVEGRPIFVDDSERWDLVRRLERLSAEACALFFAWVLMGNHVHYVVRTGVLPLAALVHRLHTGFAARFNLLHARQGHVFQSRFGSRVVASDADLMGVIRYVHRNPLDAGIVPDLGALEAYRWCGHGALVGRRAPLAFEAVDETLAVFGDDRATARARLRAWMARDAIDGDAASASGGGGAPRAAGSAPLGALIRTVCSDFGVGEPELRAGRGRPAVSRARERIAELAVRELGVPSRELAGVLGVSEGAISQALRRAAKARGLTPY